jgi:hypothetical protein
VPHYNVMGVANAALDSSVGYLAWDRGQQLLSDDARNLTGTTLYADADSGYPRDGQVRTIGTRAGFVQAGSSAAVTTSTPQNDEWRKDSSRASPRRRASRSSPTMSRSSSVIGSYMGTCSVISASNLAKKK